MNDRDDPRAALEPLLADPEISRIMVDGPGQVYVERDGQLSDVPSPFRDAAHLRAVIDALVEPLGCPLDQAHPLLDARLADGCRVNVVLPPISLGGPVLTIDKFRQRRLTFDELISWGCISADMVDFLRACVAGRLNIAIAGGVGSGKTTLLNLVAQMIPDGERIISIEEASELEWLPDRLRRVVRLEARQADLEGKGAVTARDLVLNALRMRPDRIVLGELRGAEALELFTALNSGHDGALFSLHATSPRDALLRMETMAASAEPALPLLTIRRQMASALDLIVHLERLGDGRRRVLAIAEVVGMQGDGVVLRDIFQFRQAGAEAGTIAGEFSATGEPPGFRERLRAAGIELPASLFTPGQ